MNRKERVSGGRLEETDKGKGERGGKAGNCRGRGQQGRKSLEKGAVLAL